MKTILICGHGPGISDAVARKFGGHGFRVALIARSRDKLAAAASSLAAAGVEAKPFPTDLADPKAVQATVAEVRASFGPIAVVHYNAYGRGAGDLTTADPAEVRGPFDVAVTGLVAAVQAALPDLRARKDAAVLVTGGGFAFYDPQVDAMTVQWQSMGIGISKAAQHKAVGLLRARLAGDGIYVGEVVVMGVVKGTAFDAGGHGTLEAAAIAERFWQLYGARDEGSVNFP